MRVNDILCMLESSRGNTVVVCDRAVFRVLQTYFDGTATDEMPYLLVKPGVLEMRRP